VETKTRRLQPFSIPARFAHHARRVHRDLVRDPDSPTQIGDAVRRVAQVTTDVLFVYYTGYALVDRQGRLHLSLTAIDTTPKFSLDELYRGICHHLASGGHPAPHRRTIDGAGDIDSRHSRKRKARD